MTSLVPVKMAHYDWPEEEMESVFLKYFEGTILTNIDGKNKERKKS